MSDVYVYIYDLSKGLARSMSQAILGRQIEGVWHTGIVVFGEEWFFGSQGVSNCPPCGTILGQPDEKKFQGRTQVDYETFLSHVRNLAETTFKGSDYHLLNHNCNNFSDVMSLFLTGRKIPEHITGLPREVLSTPFGQMLLPMLEQMSVNPGTNTSTSWQSSASQNSNHSSNFILSTESTTSLSAGPAASARASQNASFNASHSASTTAKTIGKFVSISAAKVKVAVSTLRKDITDDERKPLLDEIAEFCQVPVSTPIDWSLSRPHLYLLADFVSSSSSSSSAACDLLASIFMREEMIAMTLRDPKKTLPSLASSSVTNDDLIRVLANITHHPSQNKWLLNAEVPATGDSELTLFSFLTKHLEKMIEGFDEERSEHVAILLYNACLGLRDLAVSEKDADSVSGAALEMTPPILEYLVRLADRTDLQKSTSCLETLLEALDILVGINEDARDLSKCYGIQTDKISTCSGKTKLIAERLFG